MCNSSPTHAVAEPQAYLYNDPRRSRNIKFPSTKSAIAANLQWIAVARKHPEVAESVFYALRGGAVHGGQAQSIAQAMLDDKNLDPCELWAAIEGYYNTALNRANVVLFDIRRLLNIRLDPDTTATKFISDFRDCLQRLRKNNARLSDDSDTLRALLLVAIQDDDFEMVRDSIVHRPNESVESILTEIRERETSLMMKDRASNPNSDSSTRYSRRTQQSSSTSSRANSKDCSPSDANKPGNRKWCIPKYPDTWRKSFGHSFFKLALDWQTDAHKGRTQEELNKNYDTIVESFIPGQKSSKKSKSRSNTSSPESSGMASATTTGSDLQTEGDSESPRKRIRLQKSRRVVTERSA
ncbi:hypothetical protein MHU86_17333 [Fragilaria crotonensis]|nr:hypothetical protein MHU86_17333 [Fragilaria crotonensis]